MSGGARLEYSRSPRCIARRPRGRRRSKRQGEGCRRVADLRQHSEPYRGAADLQEFPAAYLISLQDGSPVCAVPWHDFIGALKRRAALSARLSG